MMGFWLLNRFLSENNWFGTHTHARTTENDFNSFETRCHRAHCAEADRLLDIAREVTARSRRSGMTTSRTLRRQKKRRCSRLLDRLQIASLHHQEKRRLHPLDLHAEPLA